MESYLENMIWSKKWTFLIPLCIFKYNLNQNAQKIEVFSGTLNKIQLLGNIMKIYTLPYYHMN